MSNEISQPVICNECEQSLRSLVKTKALSGAVKCGYSRACAKGLIKKKNQYIATINGIAGVWERSGRVGRKSKLITVFEKRVEYRARFSYYKIVIVIWRGVYHVLSQQQNNILTKQKGTPRGLRAPRVIRTPVFTCFSECYGLGSR